MWKDNVPQRLFLVARVGSFMLGSEDTEALPYIHRSGWQIWYNSAIEVDHIIPAWRLKKFNWLIIFVNFWRITMII